jgi:hypothetical protein
VLNKQSGFLKFLKLVAGTLDPLATGLLLICTGNSTKKSLNFKVKPRNISFFYRATTPSYDLETEVDQTYPIDHIDEALIHETVKQFLEKSIKTTYILSYQKMVYACTNAQEKLLKLLFKNDHSRI